jgi:hypothetical protein
LVTDFDRQDVIAASDSHGHLIVIAYRHFQLQGLFLANRDARCSDPLGVETKEAAVAVGGETTSCSGSTNASLGRTALSFRCW